MEIRRNAAGRPTNVFKRSLLNTTVPDPRISSRAYRLALLQLFFYSIFFTLLRSFRVFLGVNLVGFLQKKSEQMELHRKISEPFVFPRPEACKPDSHP